MTRWEGIVIHHSASLDSEHPDVFDIDRWHRERGFAGIGYHWVIDKVGEDWLAIQGRPMYREGAHAKGYNFNYLGVCLIGNFSEHDVPDRQLEVAADLCAGLAVLVEQDSDYRHDLCSIRYHGGLPGAATECPGTRFPRDLFRSMVARRMGE